MMNAKVIVVLLLVVAVADQSMAKKNKSKCKAKDLCTKIETLDSKFSNQIDELLERLKALEAKPTSPPVPKPVTCDEGFVKFESSCYLFANFYGPYFGAVHFCKTKHNAKLVTIESQAENNFVFKNMKQISWLGISDEAEEGKWLWVDGSPLTYTNWNDGEPNNHGGNEDFGTIYKTTGKWNDANKDGKFFFICKKSTVSE